MKGIKKKNEPPISRKNISKLSTNTGRINEKPFLNISPNDTVCASLTDNSIHIEKRILNIHATTIKMITPTTMRPIGGGAALVPCITKKITAEMPIKKMAMPAPTALSSQNKKKRAIVLVSICQLSEKSTLSEGNVCIVPEADVCCWSIVLERIIYVFFCLCQ